MIVTNIRKQQKSDRLSIFIDGNYAFSLIEEDVLFFGIKENSEISQKTYDYIINTVVYIKAQDTALKFLSHKMRTEKEIRKKLSQYEYSEAVTEKVVEFLEKYNYVNDYDYCMAYIRQSQKLNPAGSIALKQKLRFYGAKSEDIDKAISDSGLDEAAAASRLLEKKLGSMNVDDMDASSKRKLQDFLLRKGYSYDIIREAFKNKGV